MACRYYDDILAGKLKNWIPDNAKLRVLKPDETTRLFKTKADDTKDKPVKLPVIALSRSKDITLRSNIKQLKSFDGLRLYPEGVDPNLSNLKGDEYKEALEKLPNETAQFNVIPILLNYQIDIYTKTYEECDEYVRNFLFKLINNPRVVIDIPYNGANLQHVANIRVLDQVSDTTDIAEHLFAGQFTRFTIQLELQDAFLFNIPYRTNWKLYIDDKQLLPDEFKSCLEVTNKMTEPGNEETVDIYFK